MNRPLDPAFDQQLADWLEGDPSTAPREALATVLAAFPSIDQRRVPRTVWTSPLMNRYVLPAAAALIVVIGVSAVFLRGWAPVPGATPSTPVPTAPAGSLTPTSLPTTVPTVVVPLPIPDGVYLKRLPVADILAALAADPTFTDAEKNQIIDDVMHIRGVTTLTVRLTIESGAARLDEARDDGAFEHDPVWGMAGVDADTVSVDDVWMVRGHYGDHDLHWNAAQDGFTMTSSMVGSGTVESFVVHTLFDTGEFQLAR